MKKFWQKTVCAVSLALFFPCVGMAADDVISFNKAPADVIVEVTDGIVDEELAKALPKGALGKPANEYAKRVKGGRRYDADMGEGRALCMIWYNQTQNFEISIMGDRKNILQAKASPVLEKYIGRVDEYECEGRSKFWLTRQHDGFSFNRFRDSPARDYIDDTVTLYETVCKAEKELAALKR